MKKIIFILMMLFVSLVSTFAQSGWNQTVVNNKLFRYSHKYFYAKSATECGQTVSMYIRYSGSNSLDSEIENPSGKLSIFLNINGGQFDLSDNDKDAQITVTFSDKRGNNTYVLPLCYPSDGSTDFAFICDEAYEDVLFSMLKEMTENKSFRISVPVYGKKDAKVFNFKTKTVLKIK